MPGSNLLQFCMMLCKFSLKLSFLTVLHSSNWRLSHSQHNTPNLILSLISFCIFRISSTGLNHASKLCTVWLTCLKKISARFYSYGNNNFGRGGWQNSNSQERYNIDMRVPNNFSHRLAETITDENDKVLTPMIDAPMMKKGGEGG